jgi:hypothetical protein
MELTNNRSLPRGSPCMHAYDAPNNNHAVSVALNFSPPPPSHDHWFTFSKLLQNASLDTKAGALCIKVSAVVGDGWALG